MRTILEIAKELGLGLEPAGHEHRTRCPNHDDINPSLYMNPANDSWYCYGCAVGGGPIQLHQFIAGSSFDEAAVVVLGDEGPGGFIKHRLRQVDDAQSGDEGPFLLAALFRMWRGHTDAPMEQILDALAEDDPVPSLLCLCDSPCGAVVGAGGVRAL